MKKVLSVLLALALLLGCASGLAEAQEERKLPAAGDVVNGFEVKEIRDFPMIGAKLVLFEHQKTGGKVLWIANEDTNRAFQLTFRTQPLDDTGLPHVFEHATLFGSEKYPSSRIFFGASYQTYNTYMNANTMDLCTSYPLASLSEKQLLALAGFYTDSCFRPMIMSDESIFKTQAWHYNLADADGELTYEGVVYSEMQGAITLERAAMDNANRVTFPGAALSYNFGGVPEHIPEMTWEDVKNYHDRYYHPSNCLALLYGRIEDYGAFLALLDGYFSGYERAEIADADGNYTPITEPVVSKVPYPVAEGTDTANQTTVIYYIVCPGMKGDMEQEVLTDHLCTLLNEKSSALQQRMKKAFPAATVSCGREMAGPDDAICIVGYNLNENDAEQFKAVADEALLDVAANGFPQDMVDSTMHSNMISELLAPEAGNPCEGVMRSFAYEYAATGDPFMYAEVRAQIRNMDEENRQGLLAEACGKWLTEPALYTLTTTYPAPGEKEKADAALKEKLAGIKAEMTPEEVAAIVAETNAEPAEEDVSEQLAELKVVDVESLPEDVRVYPVSDETDENGIRHIDVTAGVDGIGKPQILLDAATLPQEDIHWMRLFTRLMGKLDTENHTKEELDVLLPRYMYSSVFGVNTVDLTDSIHPYVCVEWIALDEDLPTGYELAEELLFRTKFDDPEALADEVDAQITTVRSQINQQSYQILLFRGMGDRYPFYRYYTYMNFVEYYEFLLNLRNLIDENPEEVMAHFRAIQAFFRNNAGAVLTFAGNEKSIALNRTLADGFMAKLDHTEREAAVYDLPAPAAREALVIDGNVQYNCLIATPDDTGMETFDAGMMAVANLVNDTVLVPVLRDQMGVYTPMGGVWDDGTFYLITYRDPGVRETFDVYASLSDRVAAMETDQDTLNGYIMSSYSGYATPEGELTGAAAAAQDVLEGKDPLRKQTYMRQLKAVTPETVKKAAEYYRKAWENGVRSTAGGTAKISENADLYDAVMNPFNVQDTSDTSFTDVPEDHEHYAAVRFVFESGMMQPAAPDTFGVDEPATMGELLAAIYTGAVGAPGTPEEAKAMLVQAGLISEDLDLSALLTEQGMCDLLAGMGVPMQTDTPDAGMTRGELADLLMMIFGGAQE